MAGSATGSKIVHRSRGVIKISAHLLPDNNGLLRPAVAGVGFGRLLAVGYKPGTLGAGADVLITDQTGAALVSLADAGASARYMRPSTILHGVDGASIAGDADNTDVNRDIVVAGKLKVALVNAAAQLPTTSGADTGDLWSSTAHGLVAGDCVMFDTLTGGGGFSIDIPYFVIAANLTADAFQLSATRGGAAIAITSDTTVCTARKVPVFGNTTTATQAAPAVFTAAAVHGLSIGDKIVFVRLTGGTLKPALNVPYTIVTHGFTTLLFEVSALEDGAIGDSSFEVTGSAITVADWYKVGANAVAGDVYLVIDETGIGVSKGK